MARTKAEFTQTPWTTNQSYVKDRLTKLSIETLNQIETLYIYNINTEQEINLKLVPDQMAESYSPKIVTVSPFGVVTPINFYTGGNEKSISFNFRMHEDLQGIGGSIYNTVQLLKDMAKPIYRNATLLEPLVYFQLGEQFVGMGHISTTFNYNKPFRDGRYTMVEVSMTFVFHEQFEDDPIVINDNYIAELSPFAITSPLTETSAYVDDFILFQADPDYFITQVFGSQKFKTYFNTITTSVNEYILESTNQGWNAEERIEFNQSLESTVISPLLEGSDVEANEFFSNPFALSLIELFYNLRETMFSTRDTSINVFIERFINLKNALDALRTEYETSYRTRAAGSAGTEDVIEDGIGWYSRIVGTDSLTGLPRTRVVQMSDTEKTAFVELLNFYENIINSQISLYEGLRGAGN